MSKKELYFWAIKEGDDFETGYVLSESDEKAKMGVIADHKDIITADSEVQVTRPFC